MRAGAARDGLRRRRRSPGCSTSSASSSTQRGNVARDARLRRPRCPACSWPATWAAGQSLIVWAIAEGRSAAASVDQYLRALDRPRPPGRDPADGAAALSDPVRLAHNERVTFCPRENDDAHNRPCTTQRFRSGLGEQSNGEHGGTRRRTAGPTVPAGPRRFRPTLSTTPGRLRLLLIGPGPAEPRLGRARGLHREPVRVGGVERGHHPRAAEPRRAADLLAAVRRERRRRDRLPDRRA